MSLQFITGASGAGKSTYIYRQIIARSEKEPEGRFFILVPDQFTMQTQKDLVSLHDRKGIMNIDVLSFGRLTHRIFEEMGGNRLPMLDDTGKSHRGMLIDSADLVEALKDKKIGAVALDVYEEEENYFFEDKSNQVIEDDILGRLLSFYNVLITSHQAYFTKEAVDAITVTTLNNIKDFIEGKPLVNEVLQN